MAAIAAAFPSLSAGQSGFALRGTIAADGWAAAQTSGVAPTAGDAATCKCHALACFWPVSRSPTASQVH